jgi:hypothetical protein
MKPSKLAKPSNSTKKQVVRVKNNQCKYCQGACDGLFCTCVSR